MARIVKAALLQAEWTGDKDSMIEKHERFAREAAKQGAQVMCFQELFYGPYFCQVQDPQYFSYTEHIPDGPTTKRMQALAKETGMVLIVPMYEEDDQTTGIYYNTAAVIDADGSYLGKYRKTHIPHVKGFWEKYYFRPGNMGYPVFDTAVGKVGVYICYDRHFPEGARALGLNGAEIVFIPSATSRGLSEYLWRVEQVSHALANGYFVGTINRVGVEPLGDDDFYGQSYFVDPRGQFIGDVGDAHDEELIVRDLDLDKIEEVRQTWQFFRDRRPDAYDDLVRPNPMQIRRVVPDIRTDRMAESRAFYGDVIGLVESMDLGWIVGFVSSSNETAQVQLLTHDATAPVTPQMSVEVEDVEEVWRRANQAGLEIVHPLTDEPWGVRRFFVRDPNGVVVNVMTHRD